MKKFLPLLIGAMIALTFMSCGSDSETESVAGTSWAESIDMMTQDPTTAAAMSAYFSKYTLDITMEFKEDGTGTLTPETDIQFTSAMDSYLTEEQKQVYISSFASASTMSAESFSWSQNGAKVTILYTDESSGTSSTSKGVIEGNTMKIYQDNETTPSYTLTKK